jgi:HlyD family secretion protein
MDRPAAPATPTSLSQLLIARDPGAARPPGRRRWLRNRWLWLGAALAAALLAYALVHRSQALGVEFGTVAAVYPSQAVSALTATGHVSAATHASVSSKGSGRLEWLGVQEGQHVRKGQIVARLESRDVEAQREQATASLEAARANLAQGEAELKDAELALARARDLAQRHFIASSEVDSAVARADKARAATSSLRAQIAVAQANLHAAEVGVEQTLIRAPFTGVVLTKNANVGDILTPFSAASGTTGAVVTMADMTTLEVEADVSESSIAHIAPQQPAEIQLDAFPELRLAGHVSRIVPDVDRSKATLLVKVHFDEVDARVLPDMSAKVAFLTRALEPAERAAVAAVRPDAVLTRDGSSYVFVVTPPADPSADGSGASAPGGDAAPSRAVLTPVRVGERIGDLVRVEGLPPGTRVVVGAPPDLADGALVTAKKA